MTAAKKETASKEVAKQAEVEQLPAFLQGKVGSTLGRENVESADLIVPRLEIVQAISPCRKKNDPAFIEGAEEGMMFNNVTRELYGHTVFLIPVYFKKEWVIWKDRKKGGGFRGAFENQSEALNALNNLEDGADCEVQDTAQQFCLLVHPDGKLEEIVVSMNKSKLKTSRKWNSLIRMTNLDSFSRQYLVGTVEETNKNNDQYHNFNVATGPYVTDTQYANARQLYDVVVASGATVDRSDRDAEASHNSADKPF